MKQTLVALLLFILSKSAGAQVIGNLVFIVPDSAVQGQTLTTTITVPADYFVIASPPCSNEDVFMIQGSDTIFSTQYVWQWPDYFYVDFTIPGNAPPGYYDVYLSGSFYDWNGCNTIGYWVAYSGFEVVSTTPIQEVSWMRDVTLSPNPAHSESRISFRNAEGKLFKLTVWNELGKSVKTIVTRSDAILLHRKDFPAGMYFYRLEGIENELLSVGKLIFQD